MKHIVLTIIAIYAGLNFGLSSSHATPAYHSKYSGQETRAIKSLSAQDVEELQNGKGWGLAKAAELNGVPGPVHLLEMKKEINLTPEQTEKINALYQQMKHQAIQKGNELIELERQLNQHFANQTVTDSSLKEILRKIANVRQELRYIHLSTHLKTPKILTPHQIVLYNRLRGYGNNPCFNVPQGHDPEMWKKHNQCE